MLLDDTPTRKRKRAVCRLVVVIVDPRQGQQLHFRLPLRKNFSTLFAKQIGEICGLVLLCTRGVLMGGGIKRKMTISFLSVSAMRMTPIRPLTTNSGPMDLHLTSPLCSFGLPSFPLIFFGSFYVFSFAGCVSDGLLPLDFYE